MAPGRTLLLAVDGLDEHDIVVLRADPAPRPHLTALLEAPPAARIRPGGTSDPAPALVSLMTGEPAGSTGVGTGTPFLPEHPGRQGAWYASALRVPTLLDEAARAGLVTAALQWPATAGAPLDLCLPLVEDLAAHRTRWDMAEATSSPRMGAEHLAPRRAAGVQLSQVPPDALVAEIAAEALAAGRIDLTAVRLTGLGTVRRTEGLGSAAARRTLPDTADALEQTLSAFAPQPEDLVLLIPGRPLVPTTLLVHPNTALAREDLLRTEGTLLASYRAVVHPDGPRGIVHVHREEGFAVREGALSTLEALCRDHARAQAEAHTQNGTRSLDGTRSEDGDRGSGGTLTLRRVEDGEGATATTDVIGVLEGGPGTAIGCSATHRVLVDGADPYRAGPWAVTDPSAPVLVRGMGPGLPGTGRPGDVPEGSWAEIGRSLVAALGLSRTPVAS